ncbi:hypothetical protein Hanom_Chr15g01353141 [Helianthus anomalus]
MAELKGKMVIKLKIPKLYEAVTEDEESPVIGKRVFVECKKEFSLGKALGGHIYLKYFTALASLSALFPSTGFVIRIKWAVSCVWV